MSMLMTLPKPGEHSKTPLHQPAHKGQGADASAFMAAPNGAKVRGRWHRHGDDFFLLLLLFYFSVCLSCIQGKQGWMRRHSPQLPSFPRVARERLRATASVSTQELACGSPREREALGNTPFFPRAWEYLRSDKLRAERETDHNEERSLVCSVCAASCRRSSPSQRGRRVRRRSPPPRFGAESARTSHLQC